MFLWAFRVLGISEIVSILLSVHSMWGDCNWGTQRTTPFSRTMSIARAPQNGCILSGYHSVWGMPAGQENFTLVTLKSHYKLLCVLSNFRKDSVRLWPTQRCFVRYPRVTTVRKNVAWTGCVLAVSHCTWGMCQDVYAKGRGQREIIIKKD